VRNRRRRRSSEEEEGEMGEIPVSQKA